MQFMWRREAVLQKAASTLQRLLPVSARRFHLDGHLPLVQAGSSRPRRQGVLLLREMRFASG